MYVLVCLCEVCVRVSLYVSCFRVHMGAHSNVLCMSSHIAEQRGGVGGGGGVEGEAHLQGFVYLHVHSPRACMYII